MKTFTLVLFFCFAWMPASATDYQVSVDECDKDLSWNLNNTGGERGILNDGDMHYAWDNNSAITVTNISANVSYGGMWHSLIGLNQDNLSLDFKAIFGPYVKPEFQGEISEIEIVVSGAASPSNNQGLGLKLEIKDTNDMPLCSVTWPNPLTGPFPAHYAWLLPEYCKQKIKLLSWLMDNAQPGDSLSVDRIRMKASVPEIPAKEQGFLWSYSWLMSNYDPSTHMVQDRSNYHRGDSENVSATAKAAKVVYYAYKKGYTPQDQAAKTITDIADTMITKIPRGPAGVNQLWIHYTKNGGTEIDPASEWASGDTSYAALDIITALHLIGDPLLQIPDLENFLKSINWQALRSTDNYICQGYKLDGNLIRDNNLIPSVWAGFGMETAGVNLAYASATGNVAAMGTPPSDNGSGFIDNANYPFVFSGTDAWGNNWDLYRNNQADTQTGWYCISGHENPWLCNAGLFGLSAAENPEASTYMAYGAGGKSSPEDGDHEVVVLHYPAMIADIRPAEAVHEWEALRDGQGSFLLDQVIISPLNNMESMRVNKTTGKVTLSRLKGSWNLALQAEGWALADTAVKYDLINTVMNNPFLKNGIDLLDTSPVLPVRIENTPPGHYLAIQPAYNDSNDADIIKMWGVSFTESLNMDRNVAITLVGGFDSAYADNTGYTSVKGPLAIKSGKVTVERLAIQ